MKNHLIQNSEGIPSSETQFLRLFRNKIQADSNGDENEEYFLSKRKSELLSSLYGLPYALVGKRDQD